MTNYIEIHSPGPDKQGFRVHVLLDDDKNVLLVFGVEVDHLPMPPPIAWKLAIEILAKCGEANPDSKLQVRNNNITVQVYDRQVLMETRKAASELTLTPSEGRELVYRLCYTAAKAVGRDLPPDFPLEQ